MKSYLITDPDIYTNNPKSFRLKLQEAISNNNVDYICFRDKTTCNPQSLAEIYVHVCKSNNIKNIFINQYINLASSLNITGVHLTSNQLDRISYCKHLNLKVIISCHNESDIQNAIEDNADYITYSPIFTTPNKGEPKGIDDLAYIINKYPGIKIFALGGIISEEEVSKIKNTNAYGFSSIRYFTN